MKYIVAGSRKISDTNFIRETIESFDVSEIVCGTAKGPDSIGEAWAIDNDVPIAYFKPKWNKHGKKAGILRNIEMGDYADALLAFWDGKSRGTKHMIDYMKSIGKEVHVFKMEVPCEIKIPLEFNISFGFEWSLSQQKYKYFIVFKLDNKYTTVCGYIKEKPTKEFRNREIRKVLDQALGLRDDL